MTRRDPPLHIDRPARELGGCFVWQMGMTPPPMTSRTSAPCSSRTFILARAVRNYHADLLAGIESRGFLVAAPLALKLGCGFIMLRKRGKLPGATIGYDYALEYGTDRIEIQADAVDRGQRVIVVDDLLATGGTMAASIALLRHVGAIVPASAAMIELTFLNGRRRLDVPFEALVAYES